MITLLAYSDALLTKANTLSDTVITADTPQTPLALTTQSALNHMAPVPDYVSVPRVIEFMEAGADFVRVRQRVQGGVRTVHVELPAVLGMLPVALPVVPLNPFGQPKITPYTLPKRETVMLTNVAQVAAVIQEALTSSDDPRITVEDFTLNNTPLLTEASIVIGAGKGLGKGADFVVQVKQGFETVILPLARSLGGAAAASRAIIDGAGIDPAYQIGQSGKSIAPDVYLAVGISGAVQHMQGVRHSRVIIAINNDPEAPIFQSAHYGIVGDVYTLLSQLDFAYSF